MAVLADDAAEVIYAGSSKQRLLLRDFGSRRGERAEGGLCRGGVSKTTHISVSVRSGESKLGKNVLPKLQLQELLGLISFRNITVLLILPFWDYTPPQKTAAGTLSTII
jgi:hypothetical protein